ncbi:hypothetical protein PS3A_13050 [Pseudomonas sp. 3A(2025)]
MSAAPNAITQAVGALKLIPMYLNHPTVISRATLIGASAEALVMLEALPAAATELAEVFRAVDAVVHEGQTAYVTPTKSPSHPFGAVIADDLGRLVATAVGKSKEGLAELIRMQLQALPDSAGTGEARS